jgi:hypothetical protein
MALTVLLVPFRQRFLIQINPRGAVKGMLKKP